MSPSPALSSLASPTRSRTRGRTLVALIATVLTVAGLLAAAGVARPAASARAATPAAHTVTYDGYSFMVDGTRTYLWSGEFHPYRLPSPDLWRDVLQKMKAAGFNATSIYFDWGYHSPRPGVYDFTGVRDMDQAARHRAARSASTSSPGPAPYINAEVDGGGFPAWLDAKPGLDRSADPQYLKYADEWLTRIDAILQRHQLTNGTGTVIAYQVENEYYNGDAAGRAYMQHLEDKARADGITVPADRQQQRDVQQRHRRARRRRPGLLPAGLRLLEPHAVDRRARHLLRPPGGQAAVHAGVPGRRVRPVGRTGLRQVRPADQRPVRERVLQAEHRRRRHRAELLHALRRDVLGMERHPAELHQLRLRRGHHRGSAARPEVLRGQADRLLHPGRRTADQDRQPAAGARSTPQRSSTPRAATPTRARSSTRCGTPTRRPPRSTPPTSHSTSTRAAGTRTTTPTRPCSTPAAAGRTSAPSRATPRGDYQRTESFSNTRATTWTSRSPAPAVRFDHLQDGQPRHRRRLPRRQEGRERRHLRGEHRRPGRRLPGRDLGHRPPHADDRRVAARRTPPSSDTFVSVDAIDVPTAATSATYYPTVPQQPGHRDHARTAGSRRSSWPTTTSGRATCSTRRRSS